MRTIAASLALCCMLNVVASCVLPPPRHRAALVIDGVVVAVGIGLVISDPQNQNGEDHAWGNRVPGGLLAIGGLGAALITLVLAAALTAGDSAPAKGKAGKASKARAEPVRLDGQ